MTAPLLEARGLSTWLPTARGSLLAVDDVSFRVGRGETLGVVGESGSGKSLLCRSVLRLVPPGARTAGSVVLDGTELTGLPPAALRSVRGTELALVLQNPMTALNPVVRIGRQLTGSLRLHLGLDRAAARARAAELLADVGIPDPVRRLRSYPHELSGGMRQRVCIAIAVSCRPKLLFADEPTTALDVTVQRQILDLLAELRDRHGMATVLVSHNLGVVRGRTDRVLVMYGGRIVESGPTREVFGAPGHPCTAALLASVPRLSDPARTRLAGMPGRPVDLVDPAPGCRFADRCARVSVRCRTEDPPLTPIGPARAVACFHPLGDGPR